MSAFYAEGPLVIVTPAVAEGLARLLAAGKQWARTQGITLPPEVAATIDSIERLARAQRSVTSADFRTSANGSAANGSPVTMPAMTTSAVALRLGSGTRNVRDLAARGRLPATRVGRALMFDPADVAAYEAGRVKP